jgi:hypothetical protein
MARLVSDSLVSLDPRTKLAQGRWRLVLYPDAGEAVASFESAARRPRSFAVNTGGHGASEAAARRARTTVRRYCAANRLIYLWTATYGPTEAARHEPRLVRQDVRSFFRRLRQDVGRRFPYLWTTEWHPGGHGLHVHFALGERVEHGTVRSAWRRGHVWVTPPPRDGRSNVESARRVARYIAKYLVKDHEGLSGQHRYDVAQGFKPVARVSFATSPGAALLLAAQEMGTAPSRYWESRDIPDWPGPSSVGWSWE